MPAPLYPAQSEQFRNGVEVYGSYVFLTSTSHRVRVVDVFDPLAPSLVGELSLPATPRGTALEGDRLYVTSDDGFFEAMHVMTFPLRPVRRRSASSTH